MHTYDSLSHRPAVSSSSTQVEVQGSNHDGSTPAQSVLQTGRSEISFLGLTLNPMSLPELTAMVEQRVLEGRKWIITNHNLHSVYLFHRNPRLREFYKNAHWTFIDGMPLIGLGKLYGYAVEREQRTTLVDLLPPLMEMAARKGWRVFNLGSPAGVGEKAAVALRRKYPGLQIEVRHGYFDARPGSSENEAVVQQINAYKPDLLMVGMGMPRQEIWVLENFARLNAHVIMASNGAAIDYVAGAVPTPPRWAARLGLEWFSRLMNEPRRLAGRYLLEPWYILMLLTMDFVRKKGRLNDNVAGAV